MSFEYEKIVLILSNMMPVIAIINFILVLVLVSKLKKSNKRLEKFLNSNDDLSIEKLINNYINKINEVEKDNINIRNEIDLINKKVKTSVQKVGLIRYNPFEDTGGDLCYCLALLDENNNGVVLNSIFSREGSYNYAKKITNGTSENHKLSEEEKQALNKALNQNQSFAE